MLRTLVFFMFLLIPMISYAQVPSGYTQITDPSIFKAKFAEVANNTKSIRSDFSQEKTMTMLSEKIVSQGKFYFKKESKVRMEYLSPFKYLMIINGTKVYVRDGDKVTTVSTGSNKMFRQVSQIMLDCVSGNMLMNPDFDTNVFESKSNYLIEMKPVSKEIMEFFNTILVYVDKTDHSVSKIQMTEGSGDFTIMSFTNKELNRELSDSLFVL